MSLPDFIITGCARSGTGYISYVLNKAGVYCSHERVIGRKTAWGGMDRIINAAKVLSSPSGESTMWAPPLLPQFPESVSILHQVRNPIHVIRSYLCYMHAFPAGGWIEKNTPELEGVTDRLLWCVIHWVTWNRMAEHAKGTYCRYRLEDVRPHSPTANVLSKLTKAGERIHDGITETPVNVNAGSRTCMLKLNEIPPSVWKDELEKMAWGYGYDEEDLTAA